MMDIQPRDPRLAAKDMIVVLNALYHLCALAMEPPPVNGVIAPSAVPFIQGVQDACNIIETYAQSRSHHLVNVIQDLRENRLDSVRGAFMKVLEKPSKFMEAYSTYLVCAIAQKPCTEFEAGELCQRLHDEFRSLGSELKDCCEAKNSLMVYPYGGAFNAEVGRFIVKAFHQQGSQG
jgi:hypothetical protein